LLRCVTEALVAGVTGVDDLSGAGGFGDWRGPGVGLARFGVGVAVGVVADSPSRRAPRVTPSPGMLARISAAGCCRKWSATTFPSASICAFRAAMIATSLAVIAANAVWIGPGCRSSSARRICSVLLARAAGSRRFARACAAAMVPRGSRAPVSGSGALPNSSNA
jgi:hypothetical protein